MKLILHEDEKEARQVRGLDLEFPNGFRKLPRYVTGEGLLAGGVLGGVQGEPYGEIMFSAFLPAGVTRTWDIHMQITSVSTPLPRWSPDLLCLHRCVRDDREWL